MNSYLDFEKPIADLEAKVRELRELGETQDGVAIDDEVAKLQAKADQALKDTYAKLTPWQKTQVARHPQRPHCLDYIGGLIDEFEPLAGDRLYAEDHAVPGGLGRFRGRPIVVLGQEKGSDTGARIKHNFGMARPEGYRKAQRLIAMAGRFKLPVLTLVDTPGAYPGIGAEERGQAEAIARCTQACLDAEVPIVSLVIGEGGSGGAIAIATANSVLMMEHAIYSVISPEGASSILWKDATRAQDAATSMKITAQDQLQIGLVDAVVPEPLGGAHRDRERAIANAGEAIERALQPLLDMAPLALRDARREKFLAMGR
ncbi:MAG: acetyl-CoA carboxylase carboxyltransferase subunit alpha [Pseudomonadota bacterium]